MKTQGKFYTLLFVLLIVFTTSCEDDSVEPCDEDNIGTIILENKGGVEGKLHLYINPARIGSNTPGDISVEPGEKGSIDVPAGTHNILVRNIITECSGNRCAIRSTQLDEKSIDVSACQNLNMAY